MSKLTSLATRALATAAALVSLTAVAATPAEAAAQKCVGTNYTGYCYNLTSTAKSTFKTLFTDALINTRSYSATLECYVEYSSTYSSSASVSVGTEIKAWAVASMDASVSATVSNSVTATAGSRVSTTVPARSTVYCDRGTYTYVGSIKRTGWRGLETLTPLYFTVRAPSTLAWRFR